jgi:hypothetical protein
MEKILPPDVLECGRTFDRLDVTRSGKLEVADVLHWRQAHLAPHPPPHPHPSTHYPDPTTQTPPPRPHHPQPTPATLRGERHTLHRRQVARRNSRGGLGTPPVSAAALLSARKRRFSSGDVKGPASGRSPQGDAETGEAAGEAAAAPRAGAAALEAAAEEEGGEGERLLRQLQSLEAEQEEQRLLQRLRTAPRNGTSTARPHFGRHNSAGKSKFEANLSVLLSAHRESRQRARRPELEEEMEWRNPDHM